MAKKGMTVNMPGVNVNDELAAAAAGAAPAAVKQEVKADAKKKAPVKANVKVNVKAKQEVKEDNISALQEQAQKEVKSVPMNLRVKPSVKERFDYMCKKLRYSQSSFFEVMVNLTYDMVEKQEKE